jgi:hypothetical protein
LTVSYWRARRQELERINALATMDPLDREPPLPVEPPDERRLPAVQVAMPPEPPKATTETASAVLCGAEHFSQRYGALRCTRQDGHQPTEHWHIGRVNGETRCIRWE